MVHPLKNRFPLKKLLSPVLAASLLLPSVQAFAGATVAGYEEERPGALAMYGDLLLVRPVGVLITVVGAAAYVVSLPFTAPTGGMKEAGKVLVADPAKMTFARCLGCTKTGYYRSADEMAAREEKAAEAGGEAAAGSR